jgi:4-amino-4-deoxy-L-arabinose transferase-like glycosyltransferase
MSKSFTSFLKKNWLIIFFILIGAWLRLYRIEASLQFLGDQGRDALVMRRMLVDHDLPFIGPVTSVGGFYLGPLYYYLMAPFLWLANYNPVGPAIATAFIGILTLPVLYLVARTMLSETTAKLATLLYAVAAIPVIQTRSAWNPNPMPLAALGIVFGFYQALTTRRAKWLLLSGLSLGTALQLHYMIVFLAPFLLWQLVLVWRRKSLRPFLIYWFAVVILMMFPLILFEFKNRFLNYHGLVEFLSKNDYASINLWQKFLDLRGRSEQAIGMLLGFGRSFSQVRSWITRLVWVPALMIFFNKKTSFGLRTIIVWLLLTIVSIVFYRGNIYPYYLGFIFPAVFLVVAELLSRLKGIWLSFGIAFLIIFAVFNFKLLRATIMENGNLASVKKTTDFIKADVIKSGYQNYNVALIDGTKDYRASSFRYFLELTSPKPLDYDQYPQAEVLYVVSPYHQSDLLSFSIWEIESLKPAEQTAAWEFVGSENIYKIEKQ